MGREVIRTIAATLFFVATLAAADTVARDIEGVFFSDDGLAKFTFFAGKESGAPPGPDGAVPKEYHAVFESSLFASGDYLYRRKGKVLDVLPILANGESHNPTKKMIFRFSIVDEYTLYEDETGVTYHRER